MQSIEWRSVGLIAAAAVVGVLLLIVAWKAAKLLFKVFVALLFLALLAAGAWFWTHRAG